jgi:hypothetical protein
MLVLSLLLLPATLVSSAAHAGPIRAGSPLRRLASANEHHEYMKDAVSIALIRLGGRTDPELKSLHDDIAKLRTRLEGTHDKGTKQTDYEMAKDLVVTRGADRAIQISSAIHYSALEEAGVHFDPETAGKVVKAAHQNFRLVLDIASHGEAK